MERKNYLPVRVLHDFAERIERLDIAYMLTGSMAMMNYSVYRFTADVDVILEVKSEDAKRIISAFEPDYYVPHSAVSRAIFAETMFNVIHQETAFKIDCVIKKSTAFQQNVFDRRRRTDFYGRGNLDYREKRFNHFQTVMGEGPPFRKAINRREKFNEQWFRCRLY